jgi:hypothetical protein
MSSQSKNMSSQSKNMSSQNKNTVESIPEFTFIGSLESCGNSCWETQYHRPVHSKASGPYVQLVVQQR